MLLQVSIVYGMHIYRCGNFLTNIGFDIMDEIRYRRSTISQYRDQINSKVQFSLENFRRRNVKESKESFHELNTYVQKFNDLYQEAANSVEIQKNALLELNKEIYHRSNMLDDSLEQFRKAYNETVENIAPKVFQKWPAFQKKTVNSVNHSDKRIVTISIDQLILNWNSVLQATIESSKSAEELRKQAISEFSSIQDELSHKAKVLVQRSQLSLQKQIRKSEVKRERINLENQLQHLEKEGSLWVDSKKRQIETALKAIQDKITSTNSTYETLIGKRRESIYYSYMNDVTLNKVLKLIEDKDKDWKLAKSQDGIDVYKKFFGFGPGSNYACVKTSSVINSSLASVKDLLTDDHRVQEYNELFDKFRFVEVIADHTKIVWTGSTPIFPLKPRDFCTCVHVRQLKDGTIVILNRAVNHPDAPTSSQYVRGAIVLGASIIQPMKGNPNKCRLTMMTQVDPGGFSPPLIVNHISTFGPIGYIKNVEIASKKSKKRSKKLNS